MSTGEVIFLVLLIAGLCLTAFYIVFQLGKEAGCEIHEFRISQVKCLKCGREETRYNRGIVETRSKSEPTPHS